MIDLRAYLDIEQALIKRLSVSWSLFAEELHKKVLKEILEDNLPRAYSLLEEVRAGFMSQHKSYVKFSFLAAGNFGAAMASQDPKKTLFPNNHPQDLLDNVVEEFMLAITRDLEAHIIKAALSSLAKIEQLEAEDRTPVQKEDYAPAARNSPQLVSTPFGEVPLYKTSHTKAYAVGGCLIQKEEKGKYANYVKEFVDFSEQGSAYLQLVSSLHTSRLAVWGYTTEADLLGLSEYKISAVLDGRTSEFCRMINGKVFKVKDAANSINVILQAKDPQDLKALQPWPQQNKESLETYKNMSLEDLVARNLHIPPYHPGCRTILVSTDTDQELSLAPDDAPYRIPFEEVDYKEFAELGVNVTNEQLAYWNEHVKSSPTIILSKLVGKEPHEVIEQGVGFKKPISITKEGRVEFRYHYMPKDEYGEPLGMNVPVKVTFDPLLNNFHLNYMKLPKMEKDLATGAIFGITENAAKTSQAMGVKSFSLATKRSSSGFVFSRAGMSPALSDWYIVREKMLKNLDSGKLKSLEKSLTPLQLKTVRDFLEGSQERTLQALAALPYTVTTPTRTYSLAEYLLKGVKTELYLNTHSAVDVGYFVYVLRNLNPY